MLVANPEHNPAGDFCLDGDRIVAQGGTRLTFSGVGIYRPALFAGIERGSRAKLAPLLREAIAAGRVSGEMHRGRWIDVGTPARLADLDLALRERTHAGH